MIIVDGQKLRALRTERTQSINFLSEATGVPRRKIRLLESGELIDLKISELFELAAHFGYQGIDVLELLKDSNNPDAVLGRQISDPVVQIVDLLRLSLTPEQRTSVRSQL